MGLSSQFLSFLAPLPIMRSTSIVSAAALAATTFAQATPSLVYQFENAFSGVGYVNIENVAVRDNGKLLLNTVTGAIMVELDPKNPEPVIVANLTNALGNGQPGSLTGIAETCDDVYTVAAGNFAFGPSVPNGVAGIPGSNSVWNVDLSGKEPKNNLVTAIPEADTLNGVTAIPGGNKDLVLIADSGLGAVWAVNTKTGKYEIVIQNDLFLPGNTSNFGINGVQVQGPYLYFTNSAQHTFAPSRLTRTLARQPVKSPYSPPSPRIWALTASTSSRSKAAHTSLHSQTLSTWSHETARSTSLLAAPMTRPSSDPHLLLSARMVAPCTS